MRCKYCHNPDTWSKNASENAKNYTADELLKEYERGAAFYKNGGITATGGEPMCQIDFLTELFKKASERGIHTCLDTSGVTFDRTKTEKIDLLMSYTDLVMLDIKHIDNSEHIKLTGQRNGNILDFARYLSDINKPVWIRHVVVPTITFNPEYLKRLGEFMAELKNIKALDVLPYHTMGKAKYESLGIDYPLEGIEPLSTKEAVIARRTILKAYADAKNKKKKAAEDGGVK